MIIFVYWIWLVPACVLHVFEGFTVWLSVFKFKYSYIDTDKDIDIDIDTDLDSDIDIDVDVDIEIERAIQKSLGQFHPVMNQINVVSPLILASWKFIWEWRA